MQGFADWALCVCVGVWVWGEGGGGGGVRGYEMIKNLWLKLPKEALPREEVSNSFFTRTNVFVEKFWPL